MLLKEFTDKLGIDLDEVSIYDLDELNGIVKAQQKAAEGSSRLKRLIDIRAKSKGDDTSQLTRDYTQGQHA